MSAPGVFIIGGGPAGAAVALALARRGLSPVVLEAQTGPRLKVGECLPPSANPLLDAFGLTDGMRGAGHLLSHGNRFVWGSGTPAERDFICGTRGAGWRLDRRRFEEGLAAAAVEAGADWRYGQRLAACPRAAGGGWRLEVETPQGAATYEADFVVDASGRSARLARGLGARRVLYDRLVGVAAYFETRAGENGDSFTLVEAVASGWWYSARLPGGKLVVVYMTDGDLLEGPAARTAEGWLALLGAAEQTARRVAEAGGSAPTLPRVVPADTSRLTSVAGEGWLAAGDAAVAYDPLASHGITMALGGGFHAAEAVFEYLGGRRDAPRRYAALIDRAFAQYLLMRYEHYRAERRWPQEPFWRRRHAPGEAGGARTVNRESADVALGRGGRRKERL
jgi:flavin-dependent dehydrogenase